MDTWASSAFHVIGGYVFGLDLFFNIVVLAEKEFLLFLVLSEHRQPGKTRWKRKQRQLVEPRPGSNGEGSVR